MRCACSRAAKPGSRAGSRAARASCGERGRGGRQVRGGVGARRPGSRGGGGSGARRGAYLEAASARRARREVAQGVPLQLHLHVPGHPGRFPRAEAADHGQLQSQRVGETHSLASVRAAAASCPCPAAPCGRRASPAPPIPHVSPRAGTGPGPSLPRLLLRLLLEAGPLAAVVGALGQRGYKAQVARDVGARRPLAGHDSPAPQRGQRVVPGASSLARPPALRPRIRWRAASAAAGRGLSLLSPRVLGLAGFLDHLFLPLAVSPRILGCPSCLLPASALSVRSTALTLRFCGPR